MKKDIINMKLTLNPKLSAEDSRDVFDVLPKPLTSPESLEEFCHKLDEPSFRRMVVCKTNKNISLY